MVKDKALLHLCCGLVFCKLYIYLTLFGNTNLLIFCFIFSGLKLMNYLIKKEISECLCQVEEERWDWFFIQQSTMIHWTPLKSQQCNNKLSLHSLQLCHIFVYNILLTVNHCYLSLDRLVINLVFFTKLYCFYSV